MILAFIGTTELLLIAALALLLFGGKKLPELMRSLGKGVSEFKKGVREVTECSLRRIISNRKGRRESIILNGRR